MNVTSKARKKWDRIAPFYDFITKGETKGINAATRRSLFEGKKGRILEVGVGTGHNISYYPQEARVIGIDLSFKMIQKAALKARASKVAAWFICADAERLPFKDSSFDAAASTCVFCSIPEPITALREVSRVLKPGTTLHMYEHVLSKIRPLSFLMRLVGPIVAKLFGPDIARDTVGNAEKVGFEITRQENVRFFDVFKRIDAARS